MSDSGGANAVSPADAFKREMAVLRLVVAIARARLAGIDVTAIREAAAPVIRAEFGETR